MPSGPKIERNGQLSRQRCVRCGHGGSELQSARGVDGSRVASDELRCPKCGQDLYTRPARSYLELEGFEEPAALPSLPPPRSVWRHVVPKGPSTDNEVLVESGFVGRGVEGARGKGMRPGVMWAAVCATIVGVVWAFSVVW